MTCGRLSGPIGKHIRRCSDERHWRAWQDVAPPEGVEDAAAHNTPLSLPPPPPLQLCNELLVVSNHPASEHPQIAAAAAARRSRPSLSCHSRLLARAGRRSAVRQQSCDSQQLKERLHVVVDFFFFTRGFIARLPYGAAHWVVFFSPLLFQESVNVRVKAVTTDSSPFCLGGQPVEPPQPPPTRQPPLPKKTAAVWK